MTPVPNPLFGGFIGSSPAMQAVYDVIEQAAPSTAGVFITGASGAGKEIAAQALHTCSRRAHKPFIALNCAAIPHDLLESELFGHVKGAFTGAIETRPGAAARADGGTLFLDEICDLPLAMQGKLLRFLQDGHFVKIGGSKTEAADVRIVCATNKNPQEEISRGRFRDDLYYRLHIVPLMLPPLKKRGQDIMELAHVFLYRAALHEKKIFSGFDPQAEQCLMRYDWPGNVRELENLIRRIVILHKGPVVGTAMLPPALCEEPARPSSPRDPLSPIRPLAEIERQAIENALARCHGNIAQAAGLLEISPSTIYRKKAAW